MNHHHAEWLSLLEISGPFLSPSVLGRVFPQGLETVDVDLRRELRAVYDEWLDNQQGLRPDPAIHRTWIEWVLGDLLGLDDEVLFANQRLTDGISPNQWVGPPLVSMTDQSVTLRKHAITLRPDYIVRDDIAQDATIPRLLIQAVPMDQGYSATPAERMVELLRRTGVTLGLVTNGERWMLVSAPREESGSGASGPQGNGTGTKPAGAATAGVVTYGTVSYVSWYAELWLAEPMTLRAWTTLLGVRRFFGVPDNETLPALLHESKENQHTVTDQLGKQVRHAVELLVQAVDRADQMQHGTLLADVPLPDLYEAAVTVMMRLVFLLSAEERGLLPADDELYSQFYAAGTLHAQLRRAADRHGEEVVERQRDAWPRLLALFRAVHGGIHHDRLMLPAYGGGLFDPARFAFLEACTIDNRTVLHLLESLQYLQVSVAQHNGPSETQMQRISFRSLDVEQIGHVYEGLLDHTTLWADGVVLGLAGTSKKEPEVLLTWLEELRSDGGDKARKALTKILKEQTGRSPSAIKKVLDADQPNMLRERALRIACNNDDALYDRLLPWYGLIRDDDYGRPVVILPGSAYVSAGMDRRASGAHYTPRSLTEPIVQHTLEPLVYIGPAEGKPRDEWVLRPADELLQLKICDMAMGSGAFLVQTCHYLSERVVEAWGQEVRRTLTLPADPEERLVYARRLVADRCLYGVDKNPLAVEMAKLSLWLITVAKGQPFTFLDHALKVGDSLVGIDSLAQLRAWDLHADDDEHPNAPQFGNLLMDTAIRVMVQLRQEIAQMPVQDIRDQQVKAQKLADANDITHDLIRAADMLIGSYYNTLNKRDQHALRSTLLSVARDGASVEERWRADADLGDLTPLHWPLEFPEVFTPNGIADEQNERYGFDAFVVNPPFVGGRRIRDTLGVCYRHLIDHAYIGARGNADLSAFFFLRGFRLAQQHGTMGLIATNTIAQGDTRQTGLAAIEADGGSIFRAINNTVTAKVGYKFIMLS